MSARRTPAAPALWIARAATLFLAAGLAAGAAFYVVPTRGEALRWLAMAATFGCVAAAVLGVMATTVGVVTRSRGGWIGGAAVVAAVVLWFTVTARLPGRPYDPGQRPARGPHDPSQVTQPYGPQDRPGPRTLP